jgi:putative NADH-flavin reductase
MKLGILGATGFVGTVLIQKALAQGHQIKALVRSPEKLGSLKNRVEVVQGDMFDPAVLASLVAGVGAVISVAGPRSARTEGKFDAENHASYVKLLVGAMKNAKVNRLISITGVVAKVPGQPLGFKQSLVRFLLGNIVMPDVIKSKDIELKTIAESGLNWTVLRPPLMTTGKATGNVAVSEKDIPQLSKIDVDDITDFILSLLLTHEWDCKAPIVSSRKHLGVLPQPN